ncbi:MAG: hypothetical protein ACI9MR_002386 [Myxococcota bacterium]|jgi:hypothetical protein
MTALLAGLSIPTGAHAQETLPRAWKKARVGVLGIQYRRQNPDDLFNERPAVRRAREQAGVWQRRVEDALATRDQLQVIRGAQVREQFQRNAASQELVRAARARFELGVDAYHRLDRKAASDHFNRAHELYVRGFADLTDPPALADVALYRGLVLVEQGETEQARVAFRAMLLNDPGRRFDPGYHPEATEQVIRGAAADAQTRSRYVPSRLDAAAKRGKVDIWVSGVLEGEPDRLSLRLTAYDPRAGSNVLAVTIPVDDDAAADLLDRAMARLHTCIVQSDDRVRRPTRKRWFVDFGYAHMVWLRHKQTRNFLHGPGATFGVTYEPNTFLHVFGRVQQRVTLIDANADLLDPLSTTTLTLGAGLTVGNPRSVRFLAQAGLEVTTSLSDIEMTTDVNCKFWGKDHPKCGSVFTAKAPAVWFGLNLSFGVRVPLNSQWFLSANVGITNYLLEPDISGQLNFPLHGTLGFGAPF